MGPFIDVADADLILGRSVAEVLQAHAVVAHGRLRGIRHASARSDELSGAVYSDVGRAFGPATGRGVAG